MSENRSAEHQPSANGYFHPRRLTHANFVVADLDRTMNFYTRVAGIEEVYRTPETSAGFVSNGNTHHDIGFIDVNGDFSRAMKLPVGLYHLGLEMETELAMVEAYQRAMADGVKLMRTRTHDVAHSIYNRDSDGTVYEIYADVTKDWRTQRSGIITKLKPDWYPGLTPPVTEPCYHVDPPIRFVKDAIFHPDKITTAVMVVENYEAVYDDYVNIVGMTPLFGGRDSAYVILGGSLGEENLYLFRTAPGRAKGLHHISLRVEDEESLHESINILKDSGLRWERIMDHPARLGVFIKDPDGNLLKFYSDRVPRPYLADGLDEETALLLA